MRRERERRVETMKTEGGRKKVSKFRARVSSLESENKYFPGRARDSTFKYYK